MTIIFR